MKGQRNRPACLQAYLSWLWQIWSMNWWGRMTEEPQLERAHLAFGGEGAHGNVWVSQQLSGGQVARCNMMTHLVVEGTWQTTDPLSLSKRGPLAKQACPKTFPMISTENLDDSSHGCSFTHSAHDIGSTGRVQSSISFCFSSLAIRSASSSCISSMSCAQPQRQVLVDQAIRTSKMCPLRMIP